MKKWMMAAVLLVSSAACSDDENTLTGSMSEVYDLGFDSVAVVRQGDSVSVEYRQDSGGKTAKLVVNLAGLTKVDNVGIDLTELAGGSPRGTLQRVQAVTTDYPLERGTVTFDHAPDVGADVKGSFHCTLSNPAGRTLNGDFSATVTAP